MFEITNEQLVVQNTWDGGDTFSGILQAVITYHKPTGQTVVVCRARVDGEIPYRLWCWLIKNGVITGPFDTGVSWYNSNSYTDRVISDSTTGAIAVIYSNRIARLNVTDGSVSLANDVTLGAAGTPSRLHPLDGTSISMNVEYGIMYSSLNDFYVSGTRSGDTAFVLRRFLWDGSQYVVSSDSDYVFTGVTRQNSYGQSDQSSGKFLLWSRCSIGGVLADRGIVGVAHQGGVSVDSGGWFLTPQDFERTPLAAMGTEPPPVVWMTAEGTRDWDFTRGIIIPGTGVGEVGTYPWSVGQYNTVQRELISVPGSDVQAFAFHSYHAGQAQVVFIDSAGETLQEPVPLGMSSDGVKSGNIAYSEHDNVFYATAHESHSSAPRPKGLHLFTISAPALVGPQFWTNFVGQSERVA